MKTKHYDIIIIGGGISGAALFYSLASFTQAKSVALLEKYESVAALNTNARSNSQTIHCGDIETNYSAQKAQSVRDIAKRVVNFGLKHGFADKFMFSGQKMALAVGEAETLKLKKRFEDFKPLYPYLELFDKQKLKEIEPNVVKKLDGSDRKEELLAMGCVDGQYTTIDYGAMAVAMVEFGIKNGYDLYLNSWVESISKVGGRFYIKTKAKESFSADYVVVNAGAHSLYLAHKMGYGLHLSTLPIAGSFYFAKKRLLNGKVYMMQNEKLPFAALHGDPDILAGGLTRFGPTALPLPKLERYRGLSSVGDFFSSLKLDGVVVSVLLGLLKDSDIRNYVLGNFLFEIPILNKKLFVKDAQKIIPSIVESDIKYANGFGGVRPQVINKQTKRLELGEARIKTADGIAFNMTPSPGATSCFETARIDMQDIGEYLGIKIDWDKFTSELAKR